MHTHVEISLVIPVRNEESSIVSLISSIKQQTYQPSEIIIVDGGSSDKTVLLAKQATEDDARFKIIEAEPVTPGRGRNVGVAAAQHDWIAFTDAGIKLEPNWLEELVKTVKANPNLDVVYGNYEPVVSSFFEQCAVLAYVPPKQYRSNELIRGPFIASSLLKRQVWSAVGGFPDLRAAEDLIFMERVENAGFQIGWAPKATVWWSLQPSFKTTFKKFSLYSFHNVLAGRQKYWHYGIARQYAIALPFIILGLFHSAWWFCVPVIGFILRVAKSIWRHKKEQKTLNLLNPLQFLGVAAVILTVDMATFVGWIKALNHHPTAASANEAQVDQTRKDL